MPRQQESHPIVRASAVNGTLVALMWVLEAIDTFTRNSLDRFGITPRRLSELGDVFLAPWLHFGWAHLIGNSVPFLVLGILIYVSGRFQYVTTLIVTIIASGLTVWLISPAWSNTAGASGIIFGFLTYLLIRGLFTKDIKQILIAVLVFAVYGGVLWGVLPTSAGVSWQAHLGGAGGGILSAWLMHGKSDQRASGRAQY